MNYILYCKSTQVTGTRLRDILGIRGSMNAPEIQVTNLIRWGSTQRISKKPEKVYNTRMGISRATNKLESLKLLWDSNVPTPNFWEAVGIDYHRQIPTESFPVLGRDVKHTQGKDIVLCMQRADILKSNSDFFTQYIPVAREFRVHIFDGELLKISEKVLTNPEENKVCYIRNLENGYTFRNPKDVTEATKDELVNVSSRALQSHKLLFGAVDIVLSDHGRIYVLEINTGPSLSDNSLDAYAAKFAELLGIEVVAPAMEEPKEQELVELGAL